MAHTPFQPSSFRQNGLSLVELMVGLTVALIGALAISAVVQGFSAQKKTTVGSSDAQVIGGLAAYMIERDLRRAGYGANSDAVMGCSLHMATGTGATTAMAVDPVVITPGTTDTVSITYSQTRHGTYFTTLQAAYNGDGQAFAVNNAYGFSPGDLILISPATTTEASGKPICGMYQVSSLPDAGHLAHDPGVLNVPAVDALKFNSKAEVHNLGLVEANGSAELPEQVTYAINGNSELIVTSRATGMQPVSVGEQIVMLKAYYCKDTINAAASAANVCDQVAPANKAAWRQVLAIRFAVVARSATRDASAVTASPLEIWPQMGLAAGGTLAALTMPLTDEGRHYRYRVYTSVVPLRNLLWQVPAVPQS